MEAKLNLRNAALGLAALLALAAVPASGLDNAGHAQTSASGDTYLSTQIWWNFGVVSSGAFDFLVSHPTSVTPLLWVGATPVVVTSNAGNGPFACPGTGYVLDGECGNGLANLAQFCGVDIAAGLPGPCQAALPGANPCVVMGSPTEDSDPTPGVAPDFTIEYTAYPTQLFGATGEMFSNGGAAVGEENPYFTTQFLHVTYPSPVATLHFDITVDGSTGVACDAPDADTGAVVVVSLAVGDGDLGTYDFNI